MGFICERKICSCSGTGNGSIHCVGSFCWGLKFIQQLKFLVLIYQEVYYYDIVTMGGWVSKWLQFESALDKRELQPAFHVRTGCQAASSTIPLHCSLETNHLAFARFLCSVRKVCISLVPSPSTSSLSCIKVKEFLVTSWCNMVVRVSTSCYNYQLRLGLSESQPAGQTFSTSAWRRGLPNTDMISINVNMSYGTKRDLLTIASDPPSQKNWTTFNSVVAGGKELLPYC